ncbi:MAG: LexA family transcriptional regulator, partial [Synergistaceae bacterium]|nr:LexA family transcriptional regulator [Synergistaceae bacterium]
MKELRKKLDLTLDTLAKKCGVSTNTVWRWEQDKQVPMIDMLERLANALQTSVNFLTGKTSDPSLMPFIVFDDFSKLKSMEKINTKYSIILPVLDLPPFLEIENLDLHHYMAYEVTVPLIWIGNLPDKYGPFFIVVRGNAMAEAGLHEGFFALVNADEHYSNGDILLSVIRVKDGVYEAVVRWTYMLPDGSVELRCPNADYPVYHFQPNPSG